MISRSGPSNGGPLFESPVKKGIFMVSMTRTLTVCLAVSGLALAACGPKAVRGDDVAGLDEQAMSTGLDKRDLQKMLHENMQSLQTSAVVKRWEKEDRPAVAVIPMR